jgi:TRAP-type C4-dicarboxylate transport system permease small subunit
MAQSLRRLAHAHDVVTEIGGHVGKLCLVLIVFAYCYEVVARYFFASPTWWANELVSYALCIGAFLLMPVVTRRQGHVAVTVLLDLLPKAQTLALGRLLHFASFLACAVATWISLDENIRQVVQDVHLMKVRPIPQIYISAWITYGFASSALHFLRMALERAAVPAHAAGEI